MAAFRQPLEVVLDQRQNLGGVVTENPDVKLAPLNEQVKAIRALYAPLEEKLETVSRSIQKEMAEWLRIEQAKARKLEAERQAKIEAERKRQLEAIEAGKEPPKVKALPVRLQNIETPQTNVSTVAGSLSTRTTVKWKVTDLKKIPEEYTERIPNKAKLDEAAKQINVAGMGKVLGKIVPGIEFFVDTVFVRR